MIAGAAPPAVPEWLSRVTVGGRDFTEAVTDWEVEYTLGSPEGRCPIPIGRGDARGQLGFFSPRSVITPERLLSEWRPGMLWPPAPGTTTQVEVSCDGGVTWLPISGRGMVVDETSTSSDGSGEVAITAPWDRLDRTYTMGPLVPTMAPAPGLGAMRKSGVHQAWHVMRAFEAAGFTSGVPYRSDAALIVLGHGSSWPATRGTLVSSSISTSAPGPGLVGTATYRLGTSADPATTTTGYAYRQWQVCFVVDPSHAGQCQLTLGREDASESQDIQIVVESDGTVRVWKGGTQRVAAVAQGVEVDVVVVTRLADTVWLWRSGMSDPVASATMSEDTVGRDELTLMGKAGNGVVGVEVGGFYADLPLTRSTNTNRAVVEPSPLVNGLAGSPRISAESAGSMLDKLARATLASWTLDEHGVARWLPWTRDVNNAQLVLTSRDDLLGAIRRQWNLAAMASRVTVKRLNPAVQVDDEPRFRVWQGDGAELAAGKSEDTFIEVPEDEDWLGVDIGLMLSDGSKIVASNGRGTFGGATLDTGSKDSDGDPLEGPGNAYYQGSVSRVTYGTYKLTEKNTHGSKQIFRRTLDTKQSPVGWRGVNLPIVQAYGRMKWTADTSDVLTVDTGADGSAGEYVTDLGEWITQQDSRTLLDELKTVMGHPQLIVDEVEIQPDVRIQVGDMHRISAPELDWDLLVYVTSKKVAWDADKGLSMRIGFLVLSWAVDGVTYQQVEDTADYEHAANRATDGSVGTYIDLEDGETYSSLEADPLDTMI